jgi:hypothetical protein
MTIGLLDALAMGFGMKDRTQEYYDATEQSIRADPTGSYRNMGFDPNERADAYAALAESEGYPVRGGPFRLAKVQMQRDLTDAFDGGGFGYGQSGPRFEGGPSSMFLNLIGVKPMGYNQRMQSAPGMPGMPGMPLRANMATFDVLPDILK